MIRGLIDFALNNRWLVLGASILLFAWGAVSFHNLPVEAYPDVANNYVQVITQWPGRAAEEVEQQVTTPIEIQMAGIPHMAHLRSTSLAGLSSVTMVFDDESVNKDNRDQVFQRLGQVTLPAGLQPQMGTDWSPVGQIYWYTLRSTNPAYDCMELKSLQDWKLEKEFKSVPGVVDVSSFGGATREYQIRVDPDKLIAYGLSIGQVEQQITNNNQNAGGSFIEQGQQQVNVREVGLYRNVHDIEETVLKSQNGTASAGQRHRHRRRRAPRSASARSARPAASARRLPQKPGLPSPPTDPCVDHSENGKPGSKAIIHHEDGKPHRQRRCGRRHRPYCRRATTPTPSSKASTQKVAELNDHVLPPGVKIVPFLDRSELLHYTTHTVLHNLTEGIILVVIILFLFLGNVRGAIIVALTIPFALLFAAICLNLRTYPRKPALARRARLRHGGRRLRRHGREHRPPPQPRPQAKA